MFVNESIDSVFNSKNNIKNILKPKTTQEIIKDFLLLPLAKQVSIIDDLIDDEDNDIIIPFENWPLLLKIKERLKKNLNFIVEFRVTSILNVSVQPIQFKIYKVMYFDSNIKGIKPQERVYVKQYDKSFVEIVFREQTKKANNYEEFLHNFYNLITWE
jgi:hypothetical protein